jgi:hypothetical protein
VVARFGDITKAEHDLAAARTAAGFDNKKLSAAMEALARGKAGYDAAVQTERAAMIAMVQAEATARAARQALTDAVTEWTAEGEALERAAARALSGESAPTAREHTACLGDDCAPVSAREHAALVTIGAVGPVFDLKDWPADAAREMTLLSPPTQMTVRDLRASAALAAKIATETQEIVTARRAPLAAALPAWDGALKALLDAYFRPQGNSHAEENLAMAVTGYEDAVAKLKPVTAAYREAAIAADTAAAGKAPAATRLTDVLTFTGDAGRAVKRAALLAGRGDGLTVSGNGVAVCRDKACVPTAGTEAAAFVVIGAAPPGAEKSLTGLIATTRDGRRVFKLP